jgi:hypothetical protein
MNQPVKQMVLKLLDKCGKRLRECFLLQSSTNTLQEVIHVLLETSSESHAPLDETQISSWARCCSDLAFDRDLAIEALKLGVLPALVRYLVRYKSSPTSDLEAIESWSDALIALHNFALLEDAGFPEALARLDSASLHAVAANLVLAIKSNRCPAGEAAACMFS